MVTTKERIDADIKKNITPRLRETMTEDGRVPEAMTADIQRTAEKMVRTFMTDMVTPDTKAWDAEAPYAIQTVEAMLAQELVKALIKTYNL